MRGTVFVLNGDVLTDADLTMMRRFHQARGSRTTIFLVPVADPRAYGLVETNGGGRLPRVCAKPAAGPPRPTHISDAGISPLERGGPRPAPPRVAALHIS